MASHNLLRRLDQNTQYSKDWVRQSLAKHVRSSWSWARFVKVFLSQNDGPSGAHIVVQDHVKHVVYYCINIQLSPLEVR